MLLSSDKTAAEIAAECGFTSPTYLSRVFRRREGTTIRDWRT
jgi:AraC-like DNA-binding protein